MREPSHLRRLTYVATAVVAAILFMLGSALPAWAVEAMTLTFVRHGPKPPPIELARRSPQGIPPELRGQFATASSM